MLNPFRHRKVLKHGAPGRATIVSMGSLDRGATSFNLPMTLQVYVEGVTPYEISDQWMVKARDTITLSGSIPVRVDLDDLQRVAIDWETLRAEHEREVDARRDALASSGSYAGGAVPGATITFGEPQVIDLSGGDAGDVQQVLRSLGLGPDDQPRDDVISRLERLAALRASGALTEAEFEEQKRRLLGGQLG